ncbi:serine/threonine protein kinase [Halolactibacillus halophilus]|uniref:Serine/threonine-protein kinase PrkC n=1 Tax=Halolactibacillus halophilus TaxID=306540 RepID=A0A1I5LP41_9BACI|nr:Stk1 family PASTA domain-containing Ser/Thr kinase [Halolactibacillus halophilus]GEM00726.1 serine/threonine-protein kinase PrkC [Halolactibacillus halophilus]SFO99109.1 serine/threonine protein kinase [Halolactibacillus halophilus]
MLEGKVLGERYKVQSLIGGGGMANVYLGFDSILKREVAIKVLKLEYANDDDFIRRFHREAQNATSLSHPNIVTIYDVDDENDIYYMVMEYVNGMTLKRYIQLHAPLDPEEAVMITAQIAEAIQHAHDHHIIHRDIKPQNILMTRDKQVKVTDFGIALALSSTSMTQTNAVLGSVHYLSPEQARGGLANTKSDIYSLGIVLFELLTGRLPFSGQSAVSVALKHLQQVVPPVKKWAKDVPQSVENVVLKSTAKDPLNRYQSMDEFIEDLRTVLDEDRLHEAPFQVPIIEGDETKQVPVIQESLFQNQSGDDTVVHRKSAMVQDPSTMTAKNKKETSKQKKIIWGSSIAVLILLFSLLFSLFVLPILLQPDDVELIDLTDRDREEAKRWLENNNLTYDIEEVYDDSVDVNVVISQSPDSGRFVKEETGVDLVVSLGEEPVGMEDYTDQSYSQVERLLLNQDFQNVQRIDVYSEEPVGTILTQVEPQPGSDVVPSETIVVFEVSVGKRMVTLDDLIGLDELEARDYLTDKNLVAKVTEAHDNEVQEGEVIRQSPEGDVEVEEGSVVNLVVSLGEEEKPVKTYKEEVTVSYTLDELPADDENTTTEERLIPQEVRIYIGDVSHDSEKTYQVQMITEDTTFTIPMEIAPDDQAVYRIERDDQTVVQKTIRYEDIEGGE